MPKQHENLWQRGPRLCRGIVNQDLQHWKPAEQFGAGFLSGLFVVVMSLEATIDHQREALGRCHICSLNVSRLSLVGQCNFLFHWMPHVVIERMASFPRPLSLHCVVMMAVMMMSAITD